MTLCPIAIGVGCRKCPAFALCPLKSVLGDQASESAKPAKKNARKKPSSGGS